MCTQQAGNSSPGRVQLRVRDILALGTFKLLRYAVLQYSTVKYHSSVGEGCGNRGWG